MGRTGSSYGQPKLGILTLCHHGAHPSTSSARIVQMGITEALHGQPKLGRPTHCPRGAHLCAIYSRHIAEVKPSKALHGQPKLGMHTRCTLELISMLHITPYSRSGQAAVREPHAALRVLKCGSASLTSPGLCACTP